MGYELCKNPSDDVYYRLYLNRADEICIACMQWFDESDYDEDRFLSDLKFATEGDAKEYVREQLRNDTGRTRIPPEIRQKLYALVETLREGGFKNCLDFEGDDD